jgi:hypothetical protein
LPQLITHDIFLGNRYQVIQRTVVVSIQYVPLDIHVSQIAQIIV